MVHGVLTLLDCPTVEEPGGAAALVAPVGRVAVTVEQLGEVAALVAPVGGVTATVEQPGEVAALVASIGVVGATVEQQRGVVILVASVVARDHSHRRYHYKVMRSGHLGSSTRNGFH